ncbi:MAG TPA: tryptophan--tRNA ligase [Actinomycetes bacterium]|nr:tryptophan--tRNA ligase [Actinomycetes bacterium]
MPDRRSDLPRVLSGMQPTADSLHLGNYLGALVQWVALQETHESYYCVVDLHALTVQPDPDLLRQRTRVTAAQYLAGGVDPTRSALFVQSHIREHAELAWVLSCLTGYGEASRMTQFKDKSARGEVVSVGLFNYPILMAADILLYQADQVPVGADQRQHLELTRDLAIRFNARYGDAFRVPEAYIMKETAKIYDLQAVDKQMSKSLGGTGAIWLLDDPAVTVKRIRSAVTDTGREVRYDPEAKPGVSNLLAIHSALSGRSITSLEADFEGRGYGDLKTEVAEVVVEELRPFRERTLELLADPAELDRILAEGAARARRVAARTLADVYERVGLLPASPRGGDGR